LHLSSNGSTFDPFHSRIKDSIEKDMKKSTRIILYVLLILGAGALLYQLLPTSKKGHKLFEHAYVEGVLKGTVTNSSYKYVLIHLFEQDSTIFITEGRSIRSEQLQVFDTVDIINGTFSYTYRLKEPFAYPRIIYLANDSGYCERVAFLNPYFSWRSTQDFICMDRGAQITLTIDGRDLGNSKITGSPGTDVIFKRSAEANAKGIAAKKTLLQKKKAAERAKQVQDSLQNYYKHLDTATIRNFSGRKGYSKIYLKPKHSPVK
jgi:hypothetical protein